MSRRGPLVYVAPGIQDTAARILPGCPENTIAEAIVQGRVRFSAGTIHISGDGWRAVAVRTEGVLRPRPRAWRVTAITRTTTRRED